VIGSNDDALDCRDRHGFGFTYGASLMLFKRGENDALDLDGSDAGRRSSLSLPSSQ
jgi:hypothetical protein